LVIERSTYPVPLLVARLNCDALAVLFGVSPVRGHFWDRIPLSTQMGISKRKKVYDYRCPCTPLGPRSTKYTCMKCIAGQRRNGCKCTWSGLVGIGRAHKTLRDTFALRRNARAQEVAEPELETA
jgi:hypothetical protein